MAGHENSTNTIDVISTKVVPEESDRAVIVSQPKGLTDKELKEYAKETGVNFVKLKDLRKKSKLGELVERIGAARIGTSILIESPDQIGHALAECSQMMDDYRHEPEVMSQLMKAKVALIDLSVKAAQALIKSKKDSGPEESPTTQQNVPFPAAQPVTVNVQANVMAQPAKEQ